MRLAVVGAGPVGLALAIDASRRLPGADITIFDARPLEKDVGGDPRTLALSLGSIQWLKRLEAWPSEDVQPILEVNVSQQPPSALPMLGALLGEPTVHITAREQAVPMLGAVLSYGRIVGTLQRAWLAREAQQPQRLHTRFGSPVAAIKALAGGVEVDAGIVERFDLAVVAEGGVFADQARKAVRRDYHQCAWVGTVELPPAAAEGVAYERFTRHGPAALLPLPGRRASLVWCTSDDDDPVAGLDDAQRLAVLNTIFPAAVTPLRSISPLKRFALGLNAERTLCEGRTVRIGNAAQTLHPVAGQGLNLGLRDAAELVRLLQRDSDIDGMLRRLEWQRGPDRWALIAATDFLARSFTWQLPGAGAARGLGLAVLQALPPLKTALARQMMFGRR
ncbi:FAD-dependent monooxygenase [uncultured Piscinibacter sp.]|uniref:FAD-dependent monooxygenase n=1 Tax=uncultured Piscinibacter sp. TaxID=1131835 RepID=UPI00262E8AC8|nr:FAD-dependent monooxygenase [uncultured Piscinibacter sp.]